MVPKLLILDPAMASSHVSLGPSGVVSHRFSLSDFTVSSRSHGAEEGKSRVPKEVIAQSCLSVCVSHVRVGIPTLNT